MGFGRSDEILGTSSDQTAERSPDARARDSPTETVPHSPGSPLNDSPTETVPRVPDGRVEDSPDEFLVDLPVETAGRVSDGRVNRCQLLTAKVAHRAVTTRLARHPTTRPSPQPLPRRCNSGVLFGDATPNLLMSRTIQSLCPDV